ncbi:GMC oxidoreductase [Streptomyces sp. NPDC007901]|uniref:GMC oxidoreductase n=1 Tax=Streptomyces sp. NPDC007901 TaxID=3364785 RepID=UPI0036ED10A5
MRPYRVVQWATGTIGARSLRGIIEHPGLTLAGVYVHTPAKAGRDAGELCGTGPTGVTATHDVDNVLSLDADCVLYAPLTCDVDEVCRLPASGANVVTTRGEFRHPGSMDPVVRERVEEACARGGSSIHSTGSSPGFITEAVPLVLTSLARRLDGLTIDESADLSRRPSPELLFGVTGFGVAPAAFDERRLSGARTSFGPSLRLVADALGSLVPMAGLTGGTVSVPGAPLPFLVSVQTPRPTGRMRTRSADPGTPPLLDYGCLATAADRRRLREAVRATAELTATADFSEVSRGLVGPVPGVLGDDRLLDEWILGHLGTAHHTCGTVPMGPAGDPRAAVDAYGRVYGVGGLRVADTSILPTPPLRGTAATAVLIGEVVTDELRRGPA